jgi:hypothetical protein
MRGKMWGMVGMLAALVVIAVSATSAGRDVLLLVGSIAAFLFLFGVIPLVIGALAQLVLRARPLPNWAPWAGAAVMAVPAILWDTPHLVILGSRWPGLVILFVFDAMFLDYGATLVRKTRERRRSARSDSGEGVEA